MIEKEQVQKLIAEAFAARTASYVPYSGFRVGAALLTKEGKIYRGCNIENAAYTPTVCAERTAFFAAVAAGEREFMAIAIAGGKEEPKENKTAGYAWPCGVCRQVMAEFCEKDFVILTAKSPEEFKISSLKELLPEAFGPGNLKD